MTRILQLGFLSLLILYVRCDDLDYCYSEDQNPYRLFSTWTPPTNVWIHTEIKESGCKPIYVWGLLKHGVKSITDQQIKNSENLWKVKMDLEQNEKEKRMALCWDDYQNIHSSSTSFSLSKEHNEKLAKKALNSHDLFGAHLRQVMESAPGFNFDEKNVEVQTSEAKEAKAGAIKFADSFFKKSIGNGIISENKKLLKTKSSCANWAANNKEADNFISSLIMKSMVQEVSFRLGFNEGLSVEIIETMYESCVFWNLLSYLFKPPFCAAFTPTHLKIMEYWQDLKHYYEFGYGNQLSGKMGCSLVNDMIDKLVTASKGKFDEKEGTGVKHHWTGKRVNIYYGDEENLMGLITKMNLYQDEEAPKHDNYHSQKTNRKWRSSLLSPFDGSVHAVLYNCKDGEKKIEFYHNHEIVKFNACKNTQDGKCSFETFYSEVLKNLKDTCDDDFCGSFSKTPQNSSGNIISVSFTVMIACFIFNRMNLF